MVMRNASTVDGSILNVQLISKINPRKILTSYKNGIVKIVWLGLKEKMKKKMKKKVIKCKKMIKKLKVIKKWKLRMIINKTTIRVTSILIRMTVRKVGKAAAVIVAMAAVQVTLMRTNNRLFDFELD